MIKIIFPIIGFSCSLALAIILFINARNKPPKEPIVPARDYQLNLLPDSIQLYDGERLVGTVPYEEGTKFDSLIFKDNQ